MFILLSGHSGTPLNEVGELLKKHWASIGTTVYICNALQPVDLMRDSLYAVGAQFGLSSDDEAKDLFIRQSLLDWGRMQGKDFWGRAARAKADDVCGQWQKLGLHHVAVIKGLGFREDYDAFPKAYRVYLKHEAVIDAMEKKAGSYSKIHEYEKRFFGLSIDQENGEHKLFDDIANCDTFTPEEIAKRIVSGFTERLEAGFTTLTP